MARNSSTAAAPVHLDTDGAACLTGDPDLWFPHPTDMLAIREAQAICRTCPIRQACADQAIRARIPDGIYGGLTPDQRHQLTHPRKDRP